MPIETNEQDQLIRFAHDHKISYKIGWQNFTKNLIKNDALVINIEDIDTLRKLVILIYNLNKLKSNDQRILVRTAAGDDKSKYSTSFSFTAGALADVIIRLNGPQFKQITPVPDSNCVRVGPSLQIGELDRLLYEDHHLSLPTSSLIPYVTIAGLAANSGHGTGKECSSFSGLIKGMTICLPDGTISHIDESYPDFNIIRGANLGLFGIVLDLDIVCVPAKKIQCVMEKRSVPELLEALKNGLFFRDPYVSIMYVPTYQKDELTNKNLKNVIIYRFEPVDTSNPNVNSHLVFSYLLQNLEIFLENKIAIVDLLRAHPHLIPFVMKYIVSQFSIGHKDQLSVGPWYTMHYQQAYPWDIDDADYLFQVNTKSDQVVTALTSVITSLNQYANRQQYPIIDAVYLRLIKGTNGGLSTSRHDEKSYVCGFDLVSSNGIRGYNDFKQEMSKFFINGDLKALPHWGKFVPLDIDYEVLYGADYHAFKKALVNWYHFHSLSLENSMFLNNFFCQILKMPLTKQEIPQQFIQLKDEAAIENHQQTINKLIKHLVNENDPHAIHLRDALTSTLSVERKEVNQFFKSKNERRKTNDPDRLKMACCKIV